MDQRTVVMEFLGKFDHCVLATVTPEGKPECALIEFAETPSLEIVFDTSNTYRKFANMESNPNVAFAIGDRAANTGVQYEGVVTRLEGDELAAMKKIFFAKCPYAPKFEKNPDTVYYKATPRWIRYRSYDTDPMTQFELTL